MKDLELLELNPEVYATEENLRFAIVTGLKYVPHVGSLLSTMTGLMWPVDETPIEEEVVDEVNRIVNQGIKQETITEMNLVFEALKGLIAHYESSVNAKDAKNAGKRLEDAIQYCIKNMPKFKISGYTIEQLPIYTLIVNLQLGLLRDAVIFGVSKLNMTASQVTGYHTELKDLITHAKKHCSTTLASGRTIIENAVPKDSFNYKAKVWTEVNKFNRRMTFLVEDHVFYWHTFDPDFKEPIPELTREIYSDPIGSSPDNHLINPPNGSSQKRLTNLSIYGGTLIDGFYQTHGDGTPVPSNGFNGRHGSTNRPHGGTVEITIGNPLVKIRGYGSGNVPRAIELEFKDGTSKRFGDTDSTLNQNYVYPRQIISQLYSSGESRAFSCCECIIAGFRDESSYLQIKMLGKSGVWAKTAAMTSINDKLYVIQKDSLWSANPANGDYVKLGKSGVWAKTAAMTSINDKLYVIQKDSLWSVDPTNGDYVKLGNSGVWAKTAAMTSINDKLYVIQKDRFWCADPTNGDYIQIGATDSLLNTAGMTSNSDMLYIIQEDSLWRVIP
jgi:hypothetical protein